MKTTIERDFQFLEVEENVLVNKSTTTVYKTLGIVYFSDRNTKNTSGITLGRAISGTIYYIVDADYKRGCTRKWPTFVLNGHDIPFLMQNNMIDYITKFSLFLSLVVPGALGDSL